MMREASLDLKSDFVAEVLDLAQVHMVWTSRHLQEDRPAQAVATFAKLVSAVREAAEEMTAIRLLLDGDKLAGDAAAEYRANRDRAKGRVAA